MHSLIWPYATAWLLLSAPVTAFYPYLPSYLKGDKPGQRRAESVQGHIDTGLSDSFTLPLRLASVRRANNYNILSAIPPTQMDSVGIDQDGNDYTYFSPMTFGTSQEQYHMLMDTAASNTWVMSSECTSAICNAHNTLGTDKSTSLTLGTKSFSITYGTGSVNGTTASDKAHFAGKTVDLTFGLASGVSNEFANYPLDGILGFGRGSPDPHGVDSPSIIDVLASNGLIKAKLVGIHLARAADPPNDGQMNLGAPNPSLYDGDLAYIDAMDNDRGFWEIPVDDAGVEGKMAGIKGQTAILDTGTSFILMPPAAAAILHQQIDGSSQLGEAFTIPCSTTHPVQLVLGGRTYNISTKDYVGSQAENGACHSKIIGRQTFGSDQWLVGDVFLKNVYTVFDFDGARIGFGVKAWSDEATLTNDATSSQTATDATSQAPTTFATATIAVSATSSPIFPGSPSESGSETVSQTPGTSQTQPTPTSAASSLEPPYLFKVALLTVWGGLIAWA